MSCCHIDIIASRRKVRAYRGDRFMCFGQRILFIPQDPVKSNVPVTKVGFERLYLSKTQWSKIFDRVELWETKGDKDTYILAR